VHDRAVPILAPPAAGETDSLLAFLDQQRRAVRHACHGLSDHQARLAPTASALTLAGLVKHLAIGEERWLLRLPDRSEAAGAAPGSHADRFVLDAGETLAGVLERYRSAAGATDAAFRALDSLDAPVPLPPDPWYPQGVTVRWVLIHLVEETARHAGHADILREALDGATAGPLTAAAEGWGDDAWITPWRPNP
jgi:uncharacterized damage-inducible protein DinB